MDIIFHRIELNDASDKFHKICFDGEFSSKTDLMPCRSAASGACRSESAPCAPAPRASFCSASFGSNLRGERREVHAGGKRKPAVGANVRARRLHVHHLDGILEASAPGAVSPPVARSLMRSGERVYGNAVDDFADLAHSKSRRG
jgi:hypothetical protein